MRNERSITMIWLAAGAVGALLLIWLYPRLHPLAAPAMEADAELIRERARSLLRDIGVDTVQYAIIPALHQDKDAMARAYRERDAAAAVDFMRRSGQGYQWKVRMFRIDPQDAETINISGGSTVNIERLINGDIRAQFDTRGALRSLALPFADSAALGFPPPRVVLARVRSLVREHLPADVPLPLDAVAVGDSLPLSSSAGEVHWTCEDMPTQRKCTVRWAVWMPALRDSMDARVVMAGLTPSSVTLSRRHADPKADHTASIPVDIAKALFYLGISVLILVVGIKRLRAYEIGFRTALGLGVLVALLFSIWFFLQVQREGVLQAEVLVPLLIAPVMVGAALVAVTAVGESVAREVWKDTFIPIDLLKSGHLLHSKVGHAVLRGLGSGVAVAGAGMLLLWVLSPFTAVWIVEHSDTGFEQFDFFSPALYVLAESLGKGLFYFTFAILFFVSFLRARISSPLLLVPIAALVGAMANPLSLEPEPAGIAVTVVMVGIIIITFISSDALSAFIALFIASAIHQGATLLLPWNAPYHVDALLLPLAGVLLLLWGLLALRTRDRVQDFDAIAPRFQRHISERQRLSRELEIARDVQMSFLPKSDPRIPGLDIASRCAPAMEVGGDYYDFIDHGDGKLGVAIGDVSGKGTQAAFYMTLTKGFLKALGRGTASPTRVLSELNRLFYENVERGHFISMIYAVFDMQAMRVTFARAGHTPLMRRNAEGPVEVVQSRGMALGFERGALFDSAIEEITLDIRRGDVFVLYTDGYPEAMTRRREEFGEERLRSILQRQEGGSAAEILESMYRETRRFAGKAEQHDDMTMVVLRVL